MPDEQLQWMEQKDRLSRDGTEALSHGALQSNMTLQLARCGDAGYTLACGRKHGELLRFVACS